MERKKEYIDGAGVHWLEIIYRRGTGRLQELKAMYEKEGNRCWIFPFDDSKDMLSVMVKPS